VWVACIGREREKGSIAREANHRAVQRLVDVKHGIISRELFVNDALYRQEQEQVFARAWLFVGYESQVPKPRTTSPRPWAKSRSF
jgi:hypothetical protein